MPPQTKLDLSKYSPEQQQSIKQQLQLALSAGKLNPAQLKSVQGLLQSFPDPALTVPTSETREPESSVLGTAKREGMAFLKSFPQAISGAYEAATAPRSKQEQKEFPSALDYPALLYERMLHGPVTTAEDFYTAAAQGKVPNAYEQILTAAPEAMGQGASAPIMGKLMQLGGRVSPLGAAQGAIRLGSRTAEAVANQRLLPVKELINLGVPADEAARLRIRVPGRDIGLEPPTPDMQELVKQAVAEGRAAKIPTRVPAEKATPAPRKVAPPPVTGFKGPATPSAAEAAEEGITGSLPKGRGRLVLTPEEAQQVENFYKIHKEAAHRRGMAFAGGQVPESGRSVPRMPQPQTTVEWRGLKGPATEAATPKPGNTSITEQTQAKWRESGFGEKIEKQNKASNVQGLQERFPQMRSSSALTEVDNQVLSALRKHGQRGLVMGLESLRRIPELSRLSPEEIRVAATRLRDAGLVVGHTVEPSVHGPGGIVGIAIK